MKASYLRATGMELRLLRSQPLRHHGSYATLLLTLLLLISSRTAELRLSLPSQTRPPRFFINGTYSSPECSLKYMCHSGTINVIECSCHENCFLFDDCCQDERHEDKRVFALAHDTYTCEALTTLSRAATKSLYDGIDATYVINECPSGSRATRIGALCRHPLHLSENGTVSTLVTNDLTGVTYRNIFCAICHCVDLSRAVNWTPVNACIYEPSLGFDGCKVAYIPPQDTTVKMPPCREMTARSCPESATSLEKEACSNNPTRYAYNNAARQTYRNWHCTLCYNHSLAADWACTRNWAFIPYVPTLPSLDFNVLHDPANNVPDSFPLFLSAKERAFWRGSCPNISFESVNTTALGFLYENDAEAEYNVSSNSVCVRYNASFVACVPCTTAYHSNLSEDGTSSANATLRNTTYVKPFLQVLEGGGLVMCANVSSAAVGAGSSTDACPAPPTHVSTAFSGLSLFGLVAYAAAYAVVAPLRSLRGQLVLHQAATFFAGFLIHSLRHFARSSVAACTAAGILVHFFFLAGFAWTSVYAVEMVRALQLRIHGGGSARRNVCYGLGGWLAPAAITAAGAATDFSTAVSRYGPAYGRSDCFLGSAVGRRIFFVAPVAAFLSVDVFIYVYAIAKLAPAGAGPVKPASNGGVRARLFLLSKLTFVLGLTWISAILAAADDACILSNIFMLLNALQGVFVFFVYVCNSTMAGLLHRSVRRRKPVTSLAGTATATLHECDTPS